MAGSFIFFYTFLLSVELFQGGQQVFAMTAASCALNVAEVVGSFVGAIMFDRWGQRSVFWFLGAVSIINQVVLLMVLSMMEGVETSVESSRMSARVQTRLSSPTGLVRTPLKQALMYEGSMPWIQKCSSIWPKRSRLLTLEILMENRWMNIASLLVIMAAVVKGSVEEMFPFHADHRWGYDPLKIGVLFLVTAVAYLIAISLDRPLLVQNWQIPDLLLRDQLGYAWSCRLVCLCGGCISQARGAALCEFDLVWCGDGSNIHAIDSALSYCNRERGRTLQGSGEQYFQYHVGGWRISGLPAGWSPGRAPPGASQFDEDLCHVVRDDCRCHTLRCTSASGSMHRDKQCKPA